MPRILKIPLIIIVVLAVLLLFAGFALPLLFDTEDLKRTVERRVAAATGRELVIAGEFGFSVFPWLAVEAADARLANAQGFGEEPFARVERARVSVALLPLLRKRLVADTVILEGLELNLAVDRDGRSNWEGLLDAGDEAPDDETDPVFASPEVAGIELRDALVSLRDRQSGADLLFSGVNLATGALGREGPVPLRGSMRIEDRAGGQALGLELAGDLAPAENGWVLRELELELAPDDWAGPLTLSAPRLTVHPGDQRLGMERFTAGIGDAVATGRLQVRDYLDAPAWSGGVEFEEFEPEALLRALGMEPPATTDGAVLDRARLALDFAGSPAGITVEALELELDDSRVTGTLSIPDPDRTSLRFDLDIDAIDLDRYLPPGTGGGGPAPAAGEQPPGMELQGELGVGRLRLAGLDLQNVSTTVTLQGGRLRLHPLAADFYGGRYQGDIRLDTSGASPVLTLNEQIEAVAFQPLAADLVGEESVSGTAGGRLRVQGRGAGLEALLGSLAGDVQLQLDDGALEGTNLWFQVRRALAVYRRQALPEPEPKRTPFSRLALEGAIENGVLTTRELRGELPFMVLTGKGAIDLAGFSVDLDLVARVRNSPEVTADPLTAELAGKSVPLRLHGPLAGPGIELDWGSLVKEEAKNRLLDKLLDKDEKPADGTETEPAPERSRSQQRKDAARSLLEGLIRGDDEPAEEEPAGEDEPGEGDG